MSEIEIEQPVGNGIGWAVKQMRDGEAVFRKAWPVADGGHLELQVPDAYSKMQNPYIYIEFHDVGRVPWVCSHEDLLAVDWEIWKDPIPF